MTTIQVQQPVQQGVKRAVLAAKDARFASKFSKGILLGNNTRWKEVAKDIGKFAAFTFLGLGILACILFVPGSLFAFAGTLILLKLAGAATVGMAIAVSLGAYSILNVGFAVGSVLAALKQQRDEHEMNKKLPASSDSINSALPPTVAEEDPSIQVLTRPSPLKDSSSSEATDSPPPRESPPVVRRHIGKYKPYGTTSPLNPEINNGNQPQQPVLIPRVTPSAPAFVEDEPVSTSPPPTIPEGLEEEPFFKFEDITKKVKASV